MRPQIITGELGQYVPQEWTGTNTSGWRPFGDAVLILPDLGAEKVGKLGLIDLPEHMRDRNSLASETGMLVAVGAGAFAKVAIEERPKAGDRVIFARYAGRVFTGRDDRAYRAMDDNCVMVIEEINGAIND